MGDGRCKRAVFLVCLWFLKDIWNKMMYTKILRRVYAVTGCGRHKHEPCMSTEAMIRRCFTGKQVFFFFFLVIVGIYYLVLDIGLYQSTLYMLTTI